MSVAADLEYVSCRAYASMRKARGLKGGSHVAVGKAIKTGRLRDSVRYIGEEGKRRPTINPELADREWDENTSRERSPSAPQATTPPRKGGQVVAFGAEGEGTDERPRLIDRQVELAGVRAELMRLELSRKRGELLPRDEVEREAAELAALIQTRLLQFANRLTPVVARLDSERECRTAIEAEVHALLEALFQATADGDR